MNKQELINRYQELISELYNFDRKAVDDLVSDLITQLEMIKSLPQELEELTVNHEHHIKDRITQINIITRYLVCALNDMATLSIIKQVEKK